MKEPSDNIIELQIFYLYYTSTLCFTNSSIFTYWWLVSTKSEHLSILWPTLQSNPSSATTLSSSSKKGTTSRHINATLNPDCSQSDSVEAASWNLQLRVQWWMRVLHKRLWISMKCTHAEVLVCIPCLSPLNTMLCSSHRISTPRYKTRKSCLQRNAIAGINQFKLSSKAPPTSRKIRWRTASHHSTRCV